MKLSAIASALGATLENGDPDTEITGLAYDSRAVRPGFLFFAVGGMQRDGHDFAAQAVAAGAISVSGAAGAGA